MPEYLLILLLIFCATFFVQRYFKLQLFQNKKQIIVFFAVIYFIGTIWDNFAIYRGHWSYPGAGTMGIHIGLVPIEDYIFAFVTAYFALTLYQLVLKKF